MDARSGQSLLPDGRGSAGPPGGAMLSTKQRIERYQAGPKSKLFGLFLMIMVPWTMFAITNCVFSFLFHRHPSLAWLTVIFIMFFSLLFMMVDHRNKFGGKWYLKLGILSLFAISCGTYTGLHIYHFFFANYWSYVENTEYINVLPSEPAAAHMDAGKILFTVDTRVDLNKVVGYKAKDVYCIAPIVDYATTKIEYWATGLNCCQARGAFTCDAVWDPKARSALVLLDNRGVFPSIYDVFKKAADQATAEWGLTQAEKPLFVRWVSDATATQDEFWVEGRNWLVGYLGAYLGWSVIVGGIVQMSGGRKQQFTDPATGQGVRLPSAI